MLNEIFRWISIASLIGMGWFVFNVLIPIWPRRRYKAFGLAFLCFLTIILIAARLDIRFAILRRTDVDAYLVLYKDIYGPDRYVGELKSIDPKRWAREFPELAAAEQEQSKEPPVEKIQTKAPEPQISEETRRQAWIVKGQDAVRQKLKDPESASFRKAAFSNKSGSPVSCGEVNSKNSFGGFTGYQRYVSAGSADLTFLEEEVEDFDALWVKMCG